MKKNSAMPWWGWLVWLAAVVVGIVVYNHLPMQVAMHFNFSGQADKFGTRLEAVLIQPAIMLGIILLWQVLWKADSKKRSYESFWPTYRYVGGVIIVFIGLMYVWSLGQALNLAGISSMRFIPTIIGIMISLLANVFPRLRPNRWVGIRTPWTLSSMESWNRTHRLAGHLGIPTGVLILVLAWVLPNSMITLAMLVPIILWVLIAVVASYFYAKKSN